MKGNTISKPPIIAEQILSLCLPSAIKNEVLGDLSEEFNLDIKRSANRKYAVCRYWQQVLKTSTQYTIIRGKHSLLDASLKQKLLLLTGGIIFVTCYLLITLLSNINSTEVLAIDIFSELKQGNTHTIFMQKGFYPLAATSVYKIKGISYLFQFEALLWTLLSVKIFRLLKKSTITKTLFFIVSSTWLFIPYVLGTSYLKITSLPIQQVGPIVAFMLFSILYLVLPMAYMNFKNLSKSLK
jgi:hypothetical protein